MHSSTSTSAQPAAGVRKIVVLGGSGYIGSHILQELYNRAHAPNGPRLHLASITRRGEPPAYAVRHGASWVEEVQWLKGDIMEEDGSASTGGEQSSFARHLAGSSAVISCVGAFGSVQKMYAINGAANMHAIDVAKAQGVPRFIFLSFHNYTLPSFLQRGYVEGKHATEKKLEKEYGKQGVSIRPSFVYGTRHLMGNIPLPLWALGKPLQFLTTPSPVRQLCHLPYIGPFVSPLLTPPISVQAVARAAADAALDEGAPSMQVLDIDELVKYEETKLKRNNSRASSETLTPASSSH